MVSFICVPYSRLIQQERGDLKRETSACLLERLISPSEKFRAECFFFVIPRHRAPPSSLKTMLVLPGDSCNITTLLHRYSSQGALTFSYPFPSHPLSYSLLSLHILPRSVSPTRCPSFHALSKSFSVRSFHFLPYIFTSLLL